MLSMRFDQLKVKSRRRKYVRLGLFFLLLDYGFSICHQLMVCSLTKITFGGNSAQKLYVVGKSYEW